MDPAASALSPVLVAEAAPVQLTATLMEVPSATAAAQEKSPVALSVVSDRPVDDAEGTGVVDARAAQRRPLVPGDAQRGFEFDLELSPR